MALIEAGNYYHVRQWDAHGGYLLSRDFKNKRGDPIEHVRLRFPVFASVGAGLVLRHGRRGYEFAGMAWALASAAANTPRPGWLCRSEQPDWIVPLTVREVCDELLIGQEDWWTLTQALLPGTGIAWLEVAQLPAQATDVTASASDRQLGLFTTCGHPVEGATTNEAKEVSGTERSEAKRSGSVAGVTAACGLATGQVRRNGPGSGFEQLTDSVSSEAEVKNNDRDVQLARKLLDGLKTVLRQSDRQTVRALVLGALEQALGGLTAADESDRSRVFSVLWDGAAESGPPTDELRRQRLALVLGKAIALGEDATVRRPAAVFRKVMRERGYLERRRT